MHPSYYTYSFPEFRGKSKFGEHLIVIILLSLFYYILYLYLLIKMSVNIFFEPIGLVDIKILYKEEIRL